MRALSGLSIVAFIGIAVFGFAGMEVFHGHGGQGCIASIAEGVSCPEVDDIFGFVTFHLNTFKDFSLAVLSATASSALLALFLVAFLVPATIFGLGRVMTAGVCQRVERRLEFVPLPAQPQFLHWIARHERAPTLL